MSVINVLKPVCMCVNACVRVSIGAHKRTYMCVPMETCACVLASIHACVHTYVCTQELVLYTGSTGIVLVLFVYRREGMQP